MNFEQIGDLLNKIKYQLVQQTESPILFNEDELNCLCDLVQKEYNRLNTDVTPAQQKYINDICKALQISLPTGLDKKTASEFIQLHQKELNEFKKTNTVFSPASYRIFIK